MSETLPRLRRATRILLHDPKGRILLFRFVPPPQAYHPFWLCPGGEVEPGEDFRAGAIRELLEETGIVADPGPEVARRGGTYAIYTGEVITADERFFAVHTSQTSIDTTRHTEIEREAMREFRWFTRAELANWHETIYPVDILAMLDSLS